MVNEKTFKKLIVGFFILVLIILSVIVVWPIAISIITGLILAFIFNPVYKFVLNIIKEKNISALIIVLLIIFLLFIPIWFLFPVMTRQAFDVYQYSQKIDISSIVGKILPSTISQDTAGLINTFISKLINTVFSKTSDMLINISNFLLQASIVLFVFFFAMRDGNKLKQYVKEISPFSAEFESNISKQFKDMTSSVIYGHIIVGIIQGILTGIGLFIFGVPQALLLTIVAILVSVMPVIGAWLVWLPASIFLLTQGHSGAAIGLFLYGAILVSWIDNILRPYIISARTNVSSVVILVGMIGGLIMFGLIGLILGPLILSYLLIVLDAYKNKKFADFFAS